MAWHIRTSDGYIGAMATLRQAVRSCKARAFDERRSARLEHIARGAYVYHGPRRGGRGEVFTAYIYNDAGARVFGYDLQPALPFEEVCSR